MQPSPSTASDSLPALAAGCAETRRREDLAYQVMTVAAIVVLLFSLWVF
jgi:hypothetical protein